MYVKPLLVASGRVNVIFHICQAISTPYISWVLYVTLLFEISTKRFPTKTISKSGTILCLSQVAEAGEMGGGHTF